jgi:hypothetical protein
MPVIKHSEGLQCQWKNCTELTRKQEQNIVETHELITEYILLSTISVFSVRLVKNIKIQLFYNICSLPPFTKYNLVYNIRNYLVFLVFTYLTSYKLDNITYKSLK